MLTYIAPSSPLEPRNSSYQSPLPVHAMDISPSGTHVIIGGPKLLRTVQVTIPKGTDRFDLRAALDANASANSGSKGRDFLANEQHWTMVHDVKWSHGAHDNTVAVAGNQGRVMFCDISRQGAETGRMKEHERQINRLAFNPALGSLMLSGGQGGVIKMWDLRMTPRRGVRTFQVQAANAVVRDIKWSPTDGTEFALAMESGDVIRWDYRNERQWKLRIIAHSTSCNSIDYHPDGKHIASAGDDKEVKIWDLTSTTRRHKPFLFMRTPQPLSTVAWRPSTTAKGNESVECTQLATSYKGGDFRVHLWDLKRPSVPIRYLDRHSSASSALLWHSENLLWTVDREGLFFQSDMHFAPRPFERKDYQQLSWAPRGDLAFALMKRPQRRGSSMADATTIENTKKNSGENLSGSKNIPIDGAEDYHRKGHTRTSSFKGSKANLGQINSQGDSPPKDCLDLSKSLQMSGGIKMKQTHAFVQVEGIVNRKRFAALAKKYIISAFGEVPRMKKMDNSLVNLASQPLWVRLAKSVLWNAQVAHSQGLYRLSQTWKMVGKTVTGELRETAEHRRKKRWYLLRELYKQKVTQDTKSTEHHPSETEPITNEESALQRPESGMAVVVSTSNVTTPLVYPVRGTPLMTPKTAPSKMDGHSSLSSGMHIDELDLADIPPLTPSVHNTTPGSALRGDWIDATKSPSAQTHGNALSGDWVDARKSPRPPSTQTIGSALSGDWIDAAPYPDLYGESLSTIAETDSVLPQAIALPLSPRQPSKPKEEKEYNKDAVKTMGDSIQAMRARQKPSLVLETPDPMPIDENISRKDSVGSFPMFSASTESPPLFGASLSSSYGSGLYSRYAAKAKERGHDSSLTTEMKTDSYSSNSTSDLRSDDVNSSEESRKQWNGEERQAWYKSVSAEEKLVQSGTIVPEDHVTQSPTQMATDMTLQDAPVMPDGDGIPAWFEFEDQDFLPLHEVARQEEEESHELLPWSAKYLIGEALEWCINAGDIQTVATMYLLLNRFINLEHVEGSGDAIYEYIEQLAQQNLPVESAFVRKLCAPEERVAGIPWITEPVVEKIYLGLRCGNCKKPLQNVRTKASAWFCEKCSTLQEGCVICHERGKGRRWTWCQGCGHGGHDDCLRDWYDAGLGRCAAEACGHECLHGMSPEEVKTDLDVVKETKAVTKVKGLLKTEGAEPKKDGRRVTVVSPAGHRGERDGSVTPTGNNSRGKRDGFKKGSASK
jgi:WD repeat-containing protein 24